MNYYSIRDTIFCVVLFLSFLIFIIYYEKKHKGKLLNIYDKSITGVIVLIIILINFITRNFPYETFFVKFNSVEKIFSYYFPRTKIVKKYIYDNYSYILYEDEDIFRFAYFIKENKNWKVDSVTKIEEEQSLEEDQIFDNIFNTNCDISTNKILKTNTAGIIIRCNRNKNEKILVNDSLDSKFNKITENIDSESILETYETIINEKANKDYTISINNVIYKPFYYE